MDLRKTCNQEVWEASDSLYLRQKNIVTGLRVSCRDRKLRRRIENLSGEIDIVFREARERIRSGQKTIQRLGANRDSCILRQRARCDGQSSVATLRGKRVAAADLAAHGFATGEKVEVNVTGRDRANLEGLRRSP